LGLGYPGGPIVSAYADKFQTSAKARIFPFPTKRPGIPQSQAYKKSAKRFTKKGGNNRELRSWVKNPVAAGIFSFSQ